MHRDTLLRWWIVFGVGIALFCMAVYISVTNGVFDMTVKDVFNTILGIDPQPDHELVIFEFRLPRIVLSAMVGLGLGIAGAVIQGITRNGLADPGILGINSGAGAAVVLFMFFFQGKIVGTDWFAVMAMPLFGLVGGLLAAIFIFAFSWHRGRLDPQRLILVGIAVASGLGALSMYISLKMNPQDFEMATVWMSGSVWNANWHYVVAALPWLIICVPFIWFKSRKLDLLQFERDSAMSLGVAVNRETNLLLIASIGLVSACVSVSGSIGFVGLIAPHIARKLVGVSHHRMLPVCGIIGMVIVVVSDYIGRTIFAPISLPAGVVVALLGVPYFIYLLYRAPK